MAPTTFPQFSSHRMPEEIKDIIWKHTIAQNPPRTVEVNLRSREHTEYPSRTIKANVRPRKDVDDMSSEERARSFSYVSSAPIPPTLHVCSRSRNLATRRWKLVFGIEKHYHRWDDEYEGREFRGEEVPTIWFDFHQDMLLFAQYSDRGWRESQLSLEEFELDVNEQERRQVKKVWLGLYGLMNARYVNPENEMRFSGEAGEIIQVVHDAFPGIGTLYLGWEGPYEERAMLSEEIEDNWIAEAMETLFIEELEETIETEGWEFSIEFVDLIK